MTLDPELKLLRTSDLNDPNNAVTGGKIEMQSELLSHEFGMIQWTGSSTVPSLRFSSRKMVPCRSD